MDLNTGNPHSEQAPPPVMDGETSRQSHGLSPDLQAHIGRQLRAAFDEVAREPIPDRFLQLLKDLEKDGQD